MYTSNLKYVSRWILLHLVGVHARVYVLLHLVAVHAHVYVLLRLVGVHARVYVCLCVIYTWVMIYHEVLHVNLGDMRLYRPAESDIDRVWM